MISFIQVCLFISIFLSVKIQNGGFDMIDIIAEKLGDEDIIFWRTEDVILGKNFRITFFGVEKLILIEEDKNIEPNSFSTPIQRLCTEVIGRAPTERARNVHKITATW